MTSCEPSGNGGTGGGSHGFQYGIKVIDTSPTDLAYLTFAWATYPVMVGLQLLLVRWMVTWRFPTTKHGSGRRLARRLGLVE